MNKKISLVFISIVFLSLSLVAAQETEVVDTSSYSWWDNFLYKLKGLGLFTAEGQSRDCAVQASDTIDPALAGDYYSSSLVNVCNSDVALIDVFDSSWNFKNEYRSEDLGILRLTSNGIIEVYCCPYEACDSSSDCDDPHGDTCNPSYGSCYYSAPSHNTDVFACVSGNWDSQGSVSYGDDNWCSDEEDNNYLDQSGNEHCRSSPLSGWCSGNGNDDCAIEGQTCGAAGSPCCDNLICDTGITGSYKCESSGNGNGGDFSGEAMTLTTFYSTSDEDFSGKITPCNTKSDCALKDGYDVTCEESDLFSDRLYDASEGACNDQLGFLFRSIKGIVQFLLPGDLDICDIYAEGREFWRTTFDGKQFCVAKTTTWYGGLWETAMKTVDGMGIPTQYVMIITIMLLITIVGMLLRMVT